MPVLDELFSEKVVVDGLKLDSVAKETTPDDFQDMADLVGDDLGDLDVVSDEEMRIDWDSVAEDDCGANKPGGGGFQPGNTCGVKSRSRKRRRRRRKSSGRKLSPDRLASLKKSLKDTDLAPKLDDTAKGKPGDDGDRGRSIAVRRGASDHRIDQKKDQIRVFAEDDELALASGPLDGSTVILKPAKGGVRLEVNDDRYRSVSTVVRLPDGDLVVDNEYTHVYSKYRGLGLGAAMLRNQIDSSVPLGVKRLRVAAIGDWNHRKIHNGYYTWARFGFDGDLPDNWQGRMQDNGLSEIPADLRDASRLSDIFQSEGGDALWKRYGFPMEMEFDLSDGSYSQKAFARHESETVADRAKRQAEAKKRGITAEELRLGFLPSKDGDISLELEGFPVSAEELNSISSARSDWLDPVDDVGDDDEGMAIEAVGTKSDCGANQKGGGGFVKGNTCASGDSQKKTQPSRDRNKPSPVDRYREAYKKEQDAFDALKNPDVTDEEIDAYKRASDATQEAKKAITRKIEGESAKDRYKRLYKDAEDSLKRTHTLERGSDEYNMEVRTLWMLRKQRDLAQDEVSAALNAERKASQQKAAAERKKASARIAEHPSGKELIDEWGGDEDLFRDLEIVPDEADALLKAAQDAPHGAKAMLAGVVVDGDFISDDEHLDEIARRQSNLGFDIEGNEYSPGQETYDGGSWEPEEEPDMDEFMRNQYPKGYDWGGAGFLLADGTLLDMSYGRGQRADDHRSINPTDKAAKRWGWSESERSGQTAKLKTTIRKAGAFRIDGVSGSIHAETPPTRSQTEAIRDYISDYGPREVYIDANGGGAHLTSPSPHEVLSALDSAFEGDFSGLCHPGSTVVFESSMVAEHADHDQKSHGNWSDGSSAGSSIKRESSGVDTLVAVAGHRVTALRNPSVDAAVRKLEKLQDAAAGDPFRYGELRGLSDGKNIWLWDAQALLHAQAADALGLDREKLHEVNGLLRLKSTGNIRYVFSRYADTGSYLPNGQFAGEQLDRLEPSKVVIEHADHDQKSHGNRKYQHSFSTGTGRKLLGKHPGKMSDGEFLDADDLAKAERSAYFKDGKQIARSRTTPATYPDVEIGAWRKHRDYKGMYGHDIEQLIEVDPDDLMLPEGDYADDSKRYNNPEGRQDDSKRYAKWMEEGLVPPPIDVLELPNGKLKVMDGHRRAGAAKRVGKNIRAWVSWAAKSGKTDVNDKPMFTSLTHELAKKSIGKAAESLVVEHLPGQHDQSTHGNWAHGATGELKGEDVSRVEAFGKATELSKMWDITQSIENDSYRQKAMDHLQGKIDEKVQEMSDVHKSDLKISIRHGSEEERFIAREALAARYAAGIERVTSKYEGSDEEVAKQWIDQLDKDTGADASDDFIASDVASYLHSRSVVDTYTSNLDAVRERVIHIEQSVSNHEQSLSILYSARNEMMDRRSRSLAIMNEARDLINPSTTLSLADQAAQWQKNIDEAERVYLSEFDFSDFRHTRARGVLDEWRSHLWSLEPSDSDSGDHDDYDFMVAQRKQELGTFDRPEWKNWVKPTDYDWEADDDGDYETSFETKSGRKFEVLCVRNNKMAELGEGGVFEFQFSDDRGSYQKTGRGEAFEVMRSATTALADFIEEKAPYAIQFTSASKSRTDLYEFMTKRASRKMPGYTGMRVYKEGEGSDYGEGSDGGMFALVHDSKLDLANEWADRQNSVHLNVFEDEAPQTSDSLGFDDHEFDAFFWDDLEMSLFKQDDKPSLFGGEAPAQTSESALDEIFDENGFVIEASTCGAGDKGSPGFQKGNDCAKGSGGESKAIDPEGKFSVGKIKFDSKKGMGAMGFNSNINYMGYTVWMKPDQFLKLNPERVDKKGPVEIKQKMESGESIAPPFMDGVYDPKSGKTKIMGHEGRGRMMAAHQIQPDMEIPVHIKIRTLQDDGAKWETRARSIDPEATFATLTSDGRRKGSSYQFTPDRTILNKKEHASGGGAVTDSPEFKRWFGKSKAVDRSGKPLRVYHGTISKFKSFDTSSEPATWGGEQYGDSAPLFFSDDPETASTYAYATVGSPHSDYDRGRRGGRVIPAYLSLKNPLVLDSHGERFENKHHDAIQKAFKSKSHDGVIIRNIVDGFSPKTKPQTTYIVFEPTQIKSATGNSGKFDPESPDITESAIEAPTYRVVERCVDGQKCFEVKSSCGANQPGGGGFTKGNTCATGSDKNAAIKTLKAMAKKSGIDDWTGVASIYERWVKMKMTEKMGITADDAKEARRLYDSTKGPAWKTQAPSSEGAKPEWSVVPDGEEFDVRDPDDDGFYYHVTTKGTSEKILNDGLQPGKRQSMADGFYAEYSKGKVFLTDREGVNFWKGRIRDHLESQERDADLVVMRIPKDAVQGIEKDDLGSRDAHANAYFSTKAVKPKRQDQTSTPEFNRWFGNSKVVDDDGKPLRVFHGTSSGEFKEFSFQDLGEARDNAVFFSDNSDVASGYAHHPTLSEKKKIRSLQDARDELDQYGEKLFGRNNRRVPSSDRGITNHLNKMLDDGEIDWGEYDRYWDLDAKVYDLENETWPDFGDKPQVMPVFLKMSNPRVIDANGLPWDAVVPGGLESTDRDVHDGIIWKNIKDNPTASTVDLKSTTYAVFSPTQIKSASANKGTFDPDNPKINESSTYQVNFSASGIAVERKSDCGANAPGGGGFQKGNTCASDSPKGDVSLRSETKPSSEEDLIEQAREDYEKNGTRAKAFKDWFGDWEKDPDNASKILNRETGEPAESSPYSQAVDDDGNPVVVFHGTTHDFNTFSDDKGNPENSFGVGHYFTEDVGDADQNYAGEGPDLKNRISDQADRFVDQAGEMLDQLVTTGDDLTPRDEFNGLLDEFFPSLDATKTERDEIYKAYQNRELDAYDLSEEIARAHLSGEDHRTIKAYLNVRNPVILDGGDGTQFEIELEHDDDLRVERLDDMEEQATGSLKKAIQDSRKEWPKQTPLELLQELYDEDLDSKIEDIAYQWESEDMETLTESGSGFELKEAIRRVSFRYSNNWDEVNAEQLIEDIGLSYFSGEGPVSADQVVKRIKLSEAGMYITDDDGRLVPGQFISDIFQEMGFDGIIDEQPAKRFPRMGIPRSARHFIVWDSNQIKAADNRGTFDKSSDNIYEDQPSTYRVKMVDGSFVVEHANHDQKTHGNWARGIDALDMNYSKSGYDSRSVKTKAGDVVITDHGVGNYTAKIGDKEIGRADLATLHSRDFLSNIRVNDDYRRKGVATAMYDFIEDRLGYKLKRSPHHLTPDGMAFRDARDASTNTSDIPTNSDNSSEQPQGTNKNVGDSGSDVPTIDSDIPTKGFPTSKMVNVVDQWMKDNDLGDTKKWTRRDGYLPLPSDDVVQTIAQEQQAHNGQPHDPEALKSYATFKKSILSQYKALQDAGLKVYAWEGEGEPYKVSADKPWAPSSKNMRKQVAETGEFHFFMTEKGFGGEVGGGHGATENSQHPMLEMSPMKTADGKPMLYNDVFRVAHDAVAHLYGGFSFSTQGEMNGMLSHASTLPKEAHAALFAETFAQNSVYHTTGKFADQNIFVSKHVGLIDEMMEQHGRSHESLAMESQVDYDEFDDDDEPLGAGRLRRRPRPQEDSEDQGDSDKDLESRLKQSLGVSESETNTSHRVRLVMEPDGSRRYVVEAKSDCGANGPGGGGFRKGNDCASSKGSGDDSMLNRAKDLITHRWTIERTGEKKSRDAMLDEVFKDAKRQPLAIRDRLAYTLSQTKRAIRYYESERDSVNNINDTLSQRAKDARREDFEESKAMLEEKVGDLERIKAHWNYVIDNPLDEETSTWKLKHADKIQELKKARKDLKDALANTRKLEEPVYDKIETLKEAYKDGRVGKGRKDKLLREYNAEIGSLERGLDVEKDKYRAAKRALWDITFEQDESNRSEITLDHIKDSKVARRELGFNELNDFMSGETPSLKQAISDAEYTIGKAARKDVFGSEISVKHWSTYASRAHYVSQVGGFRLSENSPEARIAVHEIGHHMEHINPAVMYRANEFLRMRIAESGTHDVPMTNYKDSYEPHEIGNEDGFGDLHAGDKRRAAYNGKRYEDGATEVISMGMGAIQEIGMEFAERDEEYFRFMIGVLDGSLLGVK